ncbi:hypothetical protein AAC387_Pa03g4605 [Persea americana]
MDQCRPYSGPVKASTSDQRFLTNFIMGNYLGPDVKTDIPRRSASQRMAEGLPPYDISDLCSTNIKRSEVESLYYYVLKNAHQSAIMKLQPLDLYFAGNLRSDNVDNPEDVCNFTGLFPSAIHGGSFEIFNGIVVIDDPDISHLKPEDLQRFKWLTGVSQLKINKDEALSYHHVYRTTPNTNNNRSSVETSMEEVTAGNDDASQQFRNSFKRSHVGDILQVQKPSHMGGPSHVHLQSSVQGTPPVETTSLTEPVMLVLGSMSKIEQWSRVTDIILTGTAKDGKLGPLVGRAEIGSSKNSYFFRVAIPGVNKDDGQFCCDIESNGKVQIRGVITTDDRSALQKSRVFQMKTYHFCQPGPFQVSFRLPGPVDPRLFLGDFGLGMFEAVVAKIMEPINNNALSI